MRLADDRRSRVYENEGIPRLVELVRKADVRIVDVGCGAGANMKRLREAGHEVVGVTVSDAEAAIVRSLGFECAVCDVEREEILLSPASADALLFSHVLEHVACPEDVLRRCLRLLRPGGGVYAAFPNALQLRQRLEFLRGRFEYAEAGIMDRTHLRFFDFESARRLLESAGVEVSAHEAVGHFPLGPVRPLLGPLAARLDAAATRQWPGLFGFHILAAGRWCPESGPAA
jgi:SAM-dependent methyltransferase